MNIPIFILLFRTRNSDPSGSHTQVVPSGYICSWTGNYTNISFCRILFQVINSGVIVLYHTMFYITLAPRSVEITLYATVSFPSCRTLWCEFLHIIRIYEDSHATFYLDTKLIQVLYINTAQQLVIGLMMLKTWQC